MNTMNMPGFSAETSLYKPSGEITPLQLAKVVARPSRSV